MSDIATGIILGFLAARLLDYVMSYFFDTDVYDCSCGAECSCECDCDAEVEEILGANEPVTPAAASAATPRQVGTEPGAPGAIHGLDAPPALVVAEQLATPAWVAVTRSYLPAVTAAAGMLSVVLIWLS